MIFYAQSIYREVYAQAYCCPGVAMPCISDEINNLTYTYNPSTALCREKYNNNKYNMLLLYLRWEKLN